MPAATVVTTVTTRITASVTAMVAMATVTIIEINISIMQIYMNESVWIFQGIARANFYSCLEIVQRRDSSPPK